MMADLGMVTVNRRGRSLWLIGLLGEHDLSNITQLTRTIDEACDSGASVVVDLSEADFIASTVVSVLISASDRVEQYGGAFAVAAPTHSFMTRTLEICNATARLGLCDSLEDALRI